MEVSHMTNHAWSFGFTSATIVAFLITTFSCQVAAGPSGIEREQIQAQINAEYPELESLYKYLHAHPELSLHEEHTGLKIGEELRKAGLEVTTGVGGYGVVGILRNGSGPTVLLRTDLDALPVKEETGAGYASAAKTRND